MNQSNEQINNQKTKLKAKIDRARERLHALWDERGRTDYDVLMAGMVLDELINEYERLKKTE